MMKEETIIEVLREGLQAALDGRFDVTLTVRLKPRKEVADAEPGVIASLADRVRDWVAGHLMVEENGVLMTEEILKTYIASTGDDTTKAALTKALRKAMVEAGYEPFRTTERRGYFGVGFLGVPRPMDPAAEGGRKAHVFSADGNVSEGGTHD